MDFSRSLEILKEDIDLDEDVSTCLGDEREGMRRTVVLVGNGAGALRTACSTGPALAAALTVKGNSSSTTAGGLRVGNSGRAGGSGRGIGAVEDSWSWNLISPSTVVGIARVVVDADQNTTTDVIIFPNPVTIRLRMGR